jgi:uncharacterized protein (DUF1697 family)
MVKKQTTPCVALLRGINVGGRKLIKMDQLVRIFNAAGFANVRTLIASGNVVFDAPQPDVNRLAKTIEKHLEKALGYDVTVIVRTIDDLKKFVKHKPFNKVNASGDVMLFVTFLASEPEKKPKLPLTSVTDNMELFWLRDRISCTLARRKKTGWFGFPNNFIEKQLGVSATTRNWSTVVKLAAAGTRKDEG